MMAAHMGRWGLENAIIRSWLDTRIHQNDRMRNCTDIRVQSHIPLLDVSRL